MVNDEILRAHEWTTEIVRRHEKGHCNGTPICTPQEVAKNKATSPRGCLPISPEPKK